MPTKQADLYRLPHCSYGMRARQLLEDSGFQIDDHIFESHADAEWFMKEHGVDTTPQVFIDGERIGGSEELEKYLSGAPAFHSEAQSQTTS